MRMKDDEFYMSALVDFVDDAGKGHYTPELIEQMMRTLHEMGVRRVYWIHYGDVTYEFICRDCGSPHQDNASKTMASVGQPIEVAVSAARKFDLEIYGYIKPYETGLSFSYPEGSPEASKYGVLPRLGGPLPRVMRFVREHPQMRIRRRMSDIPPGLSSTPIRRIRIAKKDSSPTRIKKENIEIWTSPRNYEYKRKEVDFTFREEVEHTDHASIDFYGKQLTPKGAPVRALYLEGLDLKDEYVLVTTNFHDEQGDFVNSGTEMVTAYGPDDKKLLISIATDFAVWLRRRNFRNYGLAFDSGGASLTVCLDADNSSGDKGFIAFCRGKNEFLPALCEAYPEVRSFWLGMVRECLTAGVDGVDFRVEDHSTHTDDPFSYGFNEPILDEYERRYGVNILNKDYDPDLLADLRGQFYTDFLRSAASLIRRDGKKMQVHVNVDRMRSDPPVSRYLAYPWNITFDWEKWLSEGIPDEVTLRSFTKSPSPVEILADSFAQQAITACQERDLPIHYNRYIPAYEKVKEEIEMIYRDGRFQSFILYEVANMMSPDEKGNLVLRYGDCKDMRTFLQTLGL